MLGGLLVSALTLSKIGDGAGIVAGFGKLWQAHPEHFHMILSKDSPFYKDLPGLSVLIGGMWIMAWPSLPFMDRVGLVFLLALALAIVASLASKASGVSDRIKTGDVSYATTASFNIASVAVIAILCALYAGFW